MKGIFVYINPLISPVHQNVYQKCFTYSQKRNSSFSKGRPLIKDNGGLQWNHSFFLGWLKGHGPLKQATGGHNVETKIQLDQLNLWVAILPWWVLEIFEALRKVSQTEIQLTVSPETDVIMSSSTNLGLTSCISRSLPPKNETSSCKFVMLQW